MAKKAISVTLKTDNINWLKGRTGATGLRSVSELLDRLVRQARSSWPAGPVRTVIGTIDIDPSDPEMELADSAVRAVFDTSLGRPMMVRETSPEYRVRRTPAKKRRG